MSHKIGCLGSHQVIGDDYEITKTLKTILFFQPERQLLFIIFVPNLTTQTKDEPKNFNCEGQSTQKMLKFETLIFSLLSRNKQGHEVWEQHLLYKHVRLSSSHMFFGCQIWRACMALAINYRNRNPAKKTFNIPRSSSCKQTSKEIASTPETGSSQSIFYIDRSDRSCFISPPSCRKVAASAWTLVASVRIPSHKRSRNRLTAVT